MRINPTKSERSKRYWKSVWFETLKMFPLFFLLSNMFAVILELSTRFFDIRFHLIASFIAFINIFMFKVGTVGFGEGPQEIYEYFEAKQEKVKWIEYLKEQSFFTKSVYKVITNVGEYQIEMNPSDKVILNA